MERTEQLSWNVAFLVRDYPEELRTLGPNHFNCIIGEDFLDPIRKIGRAEHSILDFISSYPATRFIWVGFRVPGDDRLRALEEARHWMDGLVDGASFFGDNLFPEISDFAWVGRAESEDLGLVHYHRQIWIEQVTGADEGREIWKKRNEELRGRVLQFFALALDHHPKSKTPLPTQVRHSMRMFAHGKKTGSWGVEFICKFCALEGLVCGNETYGKAKKLERRLTALFQDDTSEFKDRLTKLWKYRSNAVHTARAFDSGSLDEGAPLGVHLEEVEQLFVGALVFALDKVATIDDVSQLWADVEKYVLPDFAKLRRPRDYPRYAVTDMEKYLGVRLWGGGKLFNEQLAKAVLSYDAANR